MDELVQKLKALAEEYKLIKKTLAKPKQTEMTTIAKGEKTSKKETTTSKEGEKTIQIGKEKPEAVKPATTNAEKDKKVANALALFKENGPKNVELAQKEYQTKLEAFRKTSETVDKIKYDTEAKAILQAKAGAAIKLKNLTQGLQILVEAGILDESTYKASAEYNGKYASMTGSFEAAARFEAKAKGVMDFLDLEAGKLIHIDLKAEAKEEVTIKGQAKIKGTTIPVELQIDAEAFARANAKAEMQMVVAQNDVTGNIDFDAGVSAGVAGKSSAALTHKGTDLIRTTGEASLEAGARIAVQAKFQFKNGKVQIVFKESLVVLVGQSVSANIEIDFVAIANAIVDKVKEQGFVEKIHAWYANVKVEAKKAAAAAQAKINAARKEVEKVKQQLDTAVKEAKVELSEKGRKFISETEARIADATAKFDKFEQKAMSVADDAGKYAKEKVQQGLENINNTSDKIGGWASKQLNKLDLNPFN